MDSYTMHSKKILELQKYSITVKKFLMYETTEVNWDLLPTRKRMNIHLTWLLQKTLTRDGHTEEQQLLTLCGEISYNVADRILLCVLSCNGGRTQGPRVGETSF
ncbi:uncharacterized protein AAG666_019742 isoform 1-T1 [Megaptera novaeangliae]